MSQPIPAANVSSTEAAARMGNAPQGAATRTQATVDQPYRIMMVCLGNICRSPTAQGVMEQQVAEAGLQQQVQVDSAGTGDYHIGHAPDHRAQAHALKRGYDISAQRARQLADADFEDFDLILVMDAANERDVLARCPEQYRHKVQRLAGYGRQHQTDTVPDPYFGGAEGFEQVLDLVEDACAGVLAEVLQGADSKMPPTGGMEG